MRAALPELPAEKRRRFVTEYGCPTTTRASSPSSREVADYFEAVAKESGNAKAASNWVMTEVLRKLKDDDAAARRLPGPPGALAEHGPAHRRGHDQRQDRQGRVREDVATGEAPEAIVEREGLTQVSDEGADQGRDRGGDGREPGQVATYRKGKTGTLGWFVGQVMKKTGARPTPRS